MRFRRVKQTALSHRVLEEHICGLKPSSKLMFFPLGFVISPNIYVKHLLSASYLECFKGSILFIVDC